MASCREEYVACVAGMLWPNYINTFLETRKTNIDAFACYHTCLGLSHFQLKLMFYDVGMYVGVFVPHLHLLLRSGLAYFIHATVVLTYPNTYILIRCLERASTSES